MNVDFFFVDHFLQREYYLFSQNTESSLKQFVFFAFFQKINNSIAKELRVTLINKRVKIFFQDVVHYTIQ